MNKKEWLRTCGARLVSKIGMEPGEAAATAESLAEFEELASGAELSFWDAPEKAADLHIAGMELNRDVMAKNAHPAPRDPQAYNASMRTRLSAGRDPFRSLSDDEE